MKVVILAGGLGTRLSEETVVKPKPMVEIGGRPILWHIMKIYSAYGLNDFIICLGYKGYLIKEYFANYSLHMSDVTFDMRTQACKIHQNKSEPWTVTLVDTGDQTLTGGRLKRIAHHLDREAFCFTYGDGVANVDVPALVDFHRKAGGLATMTVVQPPGRYGAIDLSGDQVVRFLEKPQGDRAWFNGGFFVLEPRVLDFIPSDDTAWETGPLPQLAREGHLRAFRHSGFWHPMDTLRDKTHLDDLWQSGQAPWRVW